MKLIALLGAGALAATMVSAAPADAQRYGYRHDHGSYGHRDGFRGDYRPGYHRGYGPRYGYGHRGYGRGRVVCRVHRGYYGPVRRCFRVYR